MESYLSKVNIKKLMFWLEITKTIHKKIYIYIIKKIDESETTTSTCTSCQSDQVQVPGENFPNWS